MELSDSKLTTAYRNISYFEEPGYKETYKDGSLEATRILLCSWKDRFDFVEAMLGNAELVNRPASPGNPSPVASIRRVIPEAHPDRPQLYASECEMMGGVGVPALGTDKLVSYVTRDSATGAVGTAPGFARFRVAYRFLPYKVLSDSEIAGQSLTELSRFVERRYSFASEALTVPGAYFRWKDTPNSTIPEIKPKILFTKQLQYIWHNVPALPETNIESVVGRVNNAVFDERYAAETLLCVAPETIPYASPVGKLVFRITYSFLWRRDGWNKFLRLVSTSGAIKWDDVVSRDGLTKPYDTADFSLLFNMTGATLIW